MKKVYAIIISIFFAACINAQNTGILQIQLDVNQMSGTCKLAGVDTVYIHSGLGWSNADSVWQSIVGDWGLADGKGAMTNMGNGIFSICFNVVDYYTQLATKDSTSPNGEGYGPMPAGKTPYNIGAVFRTASCPYSQITHRPECLPAKTGKDQNCENVYILRIDQPVGSSIPASNIQDNSGNEYPAITAQYISVCNGVSSGIDDLNPSFKGVNVYPVPFNNLLTIQFQYFNGAKPRVEIFDMLGNKVADLSSHVTNGNNTLTWNGKNAAGTNIVAGLYLVQISNGDQTYTGKVIKQ